MGRIYAHLSYQGRAMDIFEEVIKVCEQNLEQDELK
jgi:hypothetical protein